MLAEGCTSQNRVLQASLAQLMKEEGTPQVHAHGPPQQSQAPLEYLRLAPS